VAGFNWLMGSQPSSCLINLTSSGNTDLKKQFPYSSRRKQTFQSRNNFFFFNNVLSFIQMLATINTTKVQAPFGVSLLHLVLIIQGYNQNYMKYISKYNFYLIPFGNIYLFSIYYIIFYFH